MFRSLQRLVLSALLLAATLCSQDSTAAADPMHARVGAFAAVGSPWDKQWDRFKAATAPTGFRFDYFLRGEVGSEEIMLPATRRGRLHVGGFSLQGLASTIPELNVAMAPYVFDSAEEVDFIYDNFLAEPMAALFAEKNLVLLQWVEVGWSNVYANSPILLPKDAAGKKLRGSPNIAAQEFLKSIDADPIVMASTEVVPALQTGLIQGGVSAVPFHFYSTLKYATDFTMTQHSYDTGAIVANKKWFDRLTPEQQAVLRTAFGTSAQARNDVRTLIADQLKQMRAMGVKVHELTPEQRAEWHRATETGRRAVIERVGGQAQQVWEAIQAGKAAFRAKQQNATGSAN